eukprot:1945721-Prymnesium_polylepis.1
MVAGVISAKEGAGLGHTYRGKSFRALSTSVRPRSLMDTCSHPPTWGHVSAALKGTVHPACPVV